MIHRIHHVLFHRHLVWEFLRRDLQARYAGSVMGFFWSLIHPIILLILYTFVFGAILQVKLETYGDGTSTSDFAFYIFCGLMPWFAMQECWVRSTKCIVDNAHLIKQVRFPAKVLPAYLSISSVVNQLICSAILVIALLITQQYLPLTLIAFPLILALELVFLFGLGLLFSTLNTYLRDIDPLVSIASMVLMWASPMFYEIRMVERMDTPYALWILYANPVTYLVEIHHHIFLYGTWPPLFYWLVFGGMTLVVFVLGYVLFTKSHSEFADLL